MKKLASILLLLFICVNLFAQESVSAETEVASKKRKVIASENIIKLRKGALLVRLNTADKQLELLEKMGLDDKYVEVESEQQKQNESITSAFSTLMKFTEKVYYFYSDNTPLVVNGEFKGVLMDKDLKLISLDKFDEFFLIADFNRTENLGIPALIIYDNKMNQLQPPFPYYTRTFESLPLFDRGHHRTVEIFNESLFFEYNKYITNSTQTN
jgi:hypothetical protein